MWCIVQPDDMAKMIIHFNDINFGKVSIVPSHFYTSTRYYRTEFKRELSQPFFIFKCIVDNLINIHYVHYRWSETYNTPTKVDVNVYSNHIWDYVLNTYIRRVKRMIKEHITPTFICNCTDAAYTLDAQKRLLTAIQKTPNRLRTIVLSDYCDSLYRYGTDVKLIQLVRPIGTCINLANIYADVITSF